MKSEDDDPLIDAIRRNAASDLERLLSEDRGVEERFQCGRTPLHIAAEFGSLECARLLVDRGAALEAHDETGFTAFIYSLQEGNVDLAEFFITSGSLCHYRFVPLDTPEIRERLLRDYESLMAFGKPLVRQEHPEIYRAMEDHSFGIDPEVVAREVAEFIVTVAVSPKEFHAVHYCANVETLRLLAKHGVGSWNLDNGACYWPLKTFAEKGDTEAVAWLLQQGAEPDFTSTGETAIHAAVGGDHLECARLLIEAGANPNQHDVDGQTPMHRVSSGEMLDLLLKHGADPSIGDQCGYKPSHWVKNPELKRRLKALEAKRPSGKSSPKRKGKR